jgi:hypothetical protein
LLGVAATHDPVAKPLEGEMTSASRVRILVIAALGALLALPAQSNALVLNFEQLNAGDGLAAVNALLALHGIGMTVDAYEPGTFVIVSDGVNKYAQVHTDASGADVLFNFSSGVSSVQVEFLPFAGQGIVGLTAFNANVTPQNADGNTAAIGGTYPNLEPPQTLGFASSGDILALQLEEGANYLLFDNVVVPDLPDLPAAPVPEPGTMFLLAAGVTALAARSRRGRRP